MKRPGTEDVSSLVGGHRRCPSQWVWPRANGSRYRVWQGSTGCSTSKSQPTSPGFFRPVRLRSPPLSHHLNTTCHTWSHQLQQELQHQTWAGKRGCAWILSTYCLQGAWFYLLLTVTSFPRWESWGPEKLCGTSIREEESEEPPLTSQTMFPPRHFTASPPLARKSL